MSVSPVPQPEDNGQDFPLTSGLIGKINGMKPVAFNSDQVRELRRKVHGGYTGYLLIEVRDGLIPDDGIHRIRNLNQIIEAPEKE